MSDELQQQLVALLGAMLDAVRSGGEWAAGQVPLLVQEKVTYGRIVETGQAVLELLMVVAALVVVPKLIRFTVEMTQRVDKALCGMEGPYIASVFGGAGAILAFIVVGLSCVIDLPGQVAIAVQTWVAPRLYIIEWLRGMIG